MLALNGWLKCKLTKWQVNKTAYHLPGSPFCQKCGAATLRQLDISPTSKKCWLERAQWGVSLSFVGLGEKVWLGQIYHFLSDRWNAKLTKNQVIKVSSW